MFGFRRQTTIWRRPGGSCSVISDKVLEAEHSLIAGATGCGKSTFLHSVMQAFLIQYTPKDAKLVLLDPKVVELKRYKDLPHTIAYKTETEDIVKTLNAMVEEMNSRYQQMSYRDLDMWDGAHIYIIIEELADLMTSPEKMSVMVAIQRLTQKGRASGIHVIACTQAPSRKVIPAEITLNFTARFGLACESAIESKQIVGIAGCEALPDHGGCIYKYRREIRAVKLPYITRAEIQPLIDFWVNQKVA